AGTRQIGARADALGRIPEASIGKAAMQQDHRHAGPVRIRATEPSQRQLDTGIKGSAVSEEVDVFTEISTDFRTAQRDRKQATAALHVDFLALKRRAATRRRKASCRDSP